VEHARFATGADVARVVELARELRAELAEYRGGGLWSLRDAGTEPLEELFSDTLAQPEAMLVVGTLDGVVVGFGLATTEPLRDGSRLGRICELYVEPDARGVGIGEAIVEVMGERFGAAGCRGIDVIALPGHRAAKNFFEEQGFTARALVMHRELGRDR